MRKLITTLLILVTTIFTYSQNAIEYSDKADAKMEEKDYQYAMVLIEKAIALNDTNQWYYLKKADIQYQLSGPMDALIIVKQAILINEENPEPYSRAGSFYQSANITDSAIIMYDLAIEKAKNDTLKFSYLMNRGVAKANTRDFIGATSDYKKVLEFDPENIGALNNIGESYIELGAVDKGISCLKKIISIDASILFPYNNLGFIYSKLEKYDLAIKYFDQSLSMDSEDPFIYNNRGYAYHKKGQNLKALEDINLSLKMYPSNSYAYRNLALIYIAMDNIDEACTVLEYAKNYGFETNYGSEVSELINKHCTK